MDRDRRFAKLLELKPTAGNIGNHALSPLSNQKNPTMTPPTKDFGLVARLQFYLYLETVAALSGQPLTKKQKLYVP